MHLYKDNRVHLECLECPECWVHLEQPVTLEFLDYREPLAHKELEVKWVNKDHRGNLVILEHLVLQDSKANRAIKVRLVSLDLLD